MTKASERLTARWIRWRRRRFQQLLADGVPTWIAGMIAREEALARRKIGRVIGHLKAQEARLLCRGDDEGVKFFLMGGVSGMTDLQLYRLRTELGVELATVL